MKLNILFLCNKPPNANDANTIIDHISAFESYSRNNIFTLSRVGNLPSKLNLTQFDAVIIHYSLTLVNDYFISPNSRLLLRNYQGLKILFIQDEYRQINKIISDIDFLKIDVLFTCFPEKEMDNIYPKDKLPNVSKYSNLTGYIPSRLLNQISLEKIANRPIDVGYRTRKVPYFLGQLGYEKWNIVKQWKEHVNDNKLKVDISYNEEDRIYGKKWTQFLLSCKTVLGVESGASVMDFTGQLQTLINFHQSKYPEDPFLKIQNIYLKDYEGKYYLNQISPRCFEAIALKTVLVLFEGEYSGILIPGRHYIMLKKDFSNIDDVLLLIKDNEYLQNMAEVSYNEIALNPTFSYREFINRVDDIIGSEFKMRNKIVVDRQVKSGYFYTEEFKNANLILLNKMNYFVLNNVIHHRYLKNIKSYIRKKIISSKPVNEIRKLLRQLLFAIGSNSLVRKVKYFLTHKVRVFNPILRRIKQLLLQLN